jgi:hypothetical protein
MTQVSLLGSITRTSAAVICWLNGRRLLAMGGDWGGALGRELVRLVDGRDSVAKLLCCHEGCGTAAHDGM